MTVYDFIERERSDFDIWDKDVDHCVTVCAPYHGRKKENYDISTDEIIKRVRFMNKMTKYEAVADWSGFIKSYLDIFKSFAKKYWCYVPEDGDSLIVAWIGELHLYFAGYVSETFYNVLLNELVEKMV